MLVGGHYEKIKKSLKEQRVDTGLASDNRLYIDKHYAVKIAPPGIYEHGNIPVVILDSLVDMLNTNAKIPHTIILVINDKNFWNNKMLLKKEMAWILKKFFKEFHKIIDARKYALDHNAVNWDHPRIFITRPLPLPNNLPQPDYPPGFRSNRRKYNRILDKAQDTGKFSIMNLAAFTSQNKKGLFNTNGSISEKGYDQFWIELNDAIQKDDEQLRVLFNKLKAKQMAKAMEAELLTVDESDDDDLISDTEDKSSRQQNVQENKPKVKSPARRSLLKTFDKLKPRETVNKQQSHSPSQSQPVRSAHRDHNRNPDVHHKPQKRFPGFFKPHRRYQDYNQYFHHYPPPGYHHGPPPRYYHF